MPDLTLATAHENRVDERLRRLADMEARAVQPSDGRFRDNAETRVMSMRLLAREQQQQELTITIAGNARPIQPREKAPQSTAQATPAQRNSNRGALAHVSESRVSSTDL